MKSEEKIRKRGYYYVAHVSRFMRVCIPRFCVRGTVSVCLDARVCLCLHACVCLCVLCVFLRKL